MKPIFRWLLLGLLGLCLMGGLNSCSVCRTGCCTYRIKPGCWYCALFAKRPPVMVHYSDAIIDYCPCDCSAAGRAEARKRVSPTEASMGDLGPYLAVKGDILQVSVFTLEEHFSSEVVVSPDGKIYFMFLDGIEAEGRDLEAVAEEIEEGLRKMLASPSVSVVAKVKAGENYLVLGKVMQPGVYPLDRAVDLRQAIGAAGGPVKGSNQWSTMEIASLDGSYVIRSGQRLDLDLRALIEEGDESQNILMEPGDYLYIASSLDQQIFLVGAIGGSTIPHQDNMTLVRALTPFYGLYSTNVYARGDWNNIVIVRGSLDCPCVIRASFRHILSGDARDVNLLPGDIVYIPMQKMAFTKAMVRLAIDAFIGNFASNFGAYYAGKLLD